jgi:hypothetical protein
MSRGAKERGMVFFFRPIRGSAIFAVYKF